MEQAIIDKIVKEKPEDVMCKRKRRKMTLLKCYVIIKSKN